MVHVGIGYDVHALVAGRKLILAASRFHTPRVWTVIQTPMRLCTRFATRSLARLVNRTSAIFFRTPTALEECAEQNVSGGSRQANCQTQRENSERGCDSHCTGAKAYPHIAEMKKRIAAALGVF